MDVNLNRVDNGIYTVGVIDNDEYIGPTIARGQEWDSWMRRDVRMWHKPGTDIMDVGANIGYNTLLFSDYGPVVSFEPIFHEIVILNVKNNPLRFPVQVCECALSDKYDESVTMHIPDKGCESETLVNYGGASMALCGSGGTPVSVKCVRLDDIYTGVPSFIKIDVEGHELQMLKGATEIIKKYKPAILIEIHNFDEDDNETHQYLKNVLGYIKSPERRQEAMFLYT